MWDLSGLLNRKYDILGEHADAAMVDAASRANLNNVTAQNLPDQFDAENALKYAQTRGQNIENHGLSDGALGALHNTLTNSTGNPLGIHSNQPGYSTGAGYVAGGAKVPGKDQGVDKVHAMLRPGEAVLVPGAAEEIGRDKIAALNAKHNAQETASGKLHPQGGSPAGKQAPGKGMTPPAGKSSQKPMERDCMGSAKTGYSMGTDYAEPQEFKGGTHNVQPGKSAKTPKIDPGVIQALLSMAGGGQGGAGPAPTPALPPQAPGRGMV